MSSEVAELGTILSIWAHPDDETYLAGGIMALARRNGQRVVCVSATAGELGTPDPETWPPERLGRLRRWEAAAAMAILGVTEHRFLGYPDGGLAELDPAGPLATIRALLDEVQPDTVLTFGPDGMTFHSDHQTVSRWVTEAVRTHRPATRLLYCTGTSEHFATWRERYEEWGVFMTDERPVGVPEAEVDLCLTLSGELLDQKVAALAAMYSQVAPAIELMGVADFQRSNVTEAYVEA
jgi:LmbE family N-acetylglucosaminyl deacetylase